VSWQKKVKSSPKYRHHMDFIPPDFCQISGKAVKNFKLLFLLENYIQNSSDQVK